RHQGDRERHEEGAGGRVGPRMGGAAAPRLPACVAGVGARRASAETLLPLRNGDRGPALNVNGVITTVADGKPYERAIIAGTISPSRSLRTPPPRRGQWGRSRGRRYRSRIDVRGR